MSRSTVIETVIHADSSLQLHSEPTNSITINIGGSTTAEQRLPTHNILLLRS